MKVCRSPLGGQLFPLPDDARPEDLDLRKVGHAWIVTFRGRALTEPIANYTSAIEKQNRFAARTRQSERPCITCGETFTSTGIHHRMCNQCRQYAREVA